MRHRVKKLARGLYTYRGILITYDHENPNGPGWFFVWNDQPEYFNKRSESVCQINRYLATALELAKAPADAQLTTFDLSAYITEDILVDVQSRLATRGIPRSKARLAQIAGAGQDGIIKRIMLMCILSGLLGID